MKSIELSYSNIRTLPHLKINDIIKVYKHLSLEVVALKSGDVVESRGDGRYVSLIDGHSTFEEVMLWDSSEEQVVQSYGLIQTM